MKTKAKKTENEVEILVFLPAEETRKYFNQAASNLTKSKPIKGFRPGMAPYETVKNTYGNAAILDEFLDIALKITLNEALKQNDYFYIGSPKIDIIKLAQGDDFEYKITHPIFPDFNINNLENNLKISLPEKIEITDEEVSEAIDYILNSRAKLARVSRSAAKGDYIDIDFSSKVGDVSVENGSANNYGFILGKGSFVPGFEEAIAEMSENEEKKFSLNIPADYQYKQIAGKKVDFEVKMNAVFERISPEINDEFVKGLGGFNSVDDFRKSIRKGLLTEKKERQKAKIRENILFKLREIFDFTVSPLLIEQEALNMLADFKSNVEKSGAVWNDYLKKIGADEKKALEDFKNEAAKRLKNAIIIEKIAKEKNIKASEDEITAKINEALKYYKSPKSDQKDFSLDDLKNRVRQNLIYEETFKLLEGIIGYNEL